MKLEDRDDELGVFELGVFELGDSRLTLSIDGVRDLPDRRATRPPKGDRDFVSKLNETLRRLLAGGVELEGCSEGGGSGSSDFSDRWEEERKEVGRRGALDSGEVGDERVKEFWKNGSRGVTWEISESTGVIF